MASFPPERCRPLPERRGTGIEPWSIRVFSMDGLARSSFGWKGRRSPLIVALLVFTLFFSSLIGSVKRSQDTAELVAFGPSGIVLCVSSDDSSDGLPDHTPLAHHETECCVLCAVNHVPTAVNITLLPYTVAFFGFERYISSSLIGYSPPDIARTDGVFPFDVPARAPPFSAA